MDLNRYPSNSNASKIKRTDDIQEKRVTIDPSRRAEHKQNFFRRIIADDISNVKDDIVDNILLPTARDVVVNIVTSAIETIIYGSSGSPSRYSRGGRVNYSGIYSGGLKSSRVVRLNDDEPRRQRVGQPGLYYQDIVMSKPEIDDVIWRLSQVEDQYGLTSISDLYDAIGKTIGNGEDPFKNVREFTDNQWGWSDISRARAEKVPNGYILRMPRIEPL